MTNPTTPPLPSGDDLSVRLGEVATAWKRHVEATERMNAAIPDFEATPAERALYSERYKAKNAIEREMRAVSMDFAKWCAETSADQSLLAEHAALNARVEEARGHVGALLAVIDAQDVEYLGESIHAGLRKGSEAPDSGLLSRRRRVMDDNGGSLPPELIAQLTCLPEEAPEDFTCVICEDIASNQFRWSPRDYERPPICKSCESITGYAWTGGTRHRTMPKGGSHRDRREALRIGALADAISQEATQHQWRNRHGRA